jgi:hypothetical protein
MRQLLSIGRLIPRPGIIIAVVAVLFLAGVWVACAGTGACIGEPGSYCKDGWTSAECSDWNNLGVNGSSWSFHAGQTCSSLGYTPTP